MNTVGRERWLAIVAVALAIIFWASAFVGIRAAGGQLSPGALSLGRLVVGSFALGLWVLVRREKMIPRRDIRNLLLCGLLWFGAYNLVLNQAERMVDAGTAAILVNIGPAFIALLGGLLLGEGFPRRLIIGCAIAFTGTVIIGLATSSHGIQAGMGALLCLVAAALYASGVTLEKPMLARSSSLVITWLACTVGAILCLPFAPLLFQELGTASVTSVAWMLYLGLVPTALGFTFWSYALARSSAGKMGSTTYLVPPVAIIIGWVLLGELPPTLAYAGGVLCLLGVAITTGLLSPQRLGFRPNSLNG